MFPSRSKRILALALNAKGNTCENSDTEVYESSGSEYYPSEDENSGSSRDTCFDQSSASNCKTTSSPPSPEIPTAEPIIHYFSETPSQNLTEENDEITENVSKSKRQRRIRRKHHCPFCDLNVGNFARHLERNHGDETAVQKYMSINKNSLERKKLIDKLRREGDFCTSNIIPVMSIQQTSEENYIVCKFCLGYYSKRSLRRHIKKCYFNPDPSKPFKAQIEGQTTMSGHFGPNDILRTSGVLSMMRADDVSITAKKDKIICEVGRRYIRSHKEKHLLLVAKRYMRRLARLLLSARKLEKNNNLRMTDILSPKRYKLLITATQQISEYDEKSRTFKSPSLALQMGTLIKAAINATFSMEIQSETSNSKRLEELKALTTLIETDWAHEISSEAGQNLAINKFNKPTLIPLAEDVAKFGKYLKELILRSKTALVENSKNVKSYRELQEGIFCSILIFNKRRVGELQRMLLSAYLKYSDAPPPSSEFEKALTESEKILYKSLKRVVIRGKRGRGVPVLLQRQIVESLDFAVTLRINFNLEENPYLFGLPGTENPITGNAIMRKHAKIALKCSSKASLLTSTKLRKHLATIVQILNMDKNELEQLATFMGHTEKTHSEFYRLPADIYQTAKVSKLLLLAQSSSIEHFKGKSLTDIEVNDVVEEDTADSDDGIEIENNLTLPEREDKMETEQEHNVENIKIKRGPRRTLVSWTPEQKKLTEEFFKKHIKNKKPPKKDEVLALIQKHPGVFHNKAWKVIKVYVHNKYSKK